MATNLIIEGLGNGANTILGCHDPFQIVPLPKPFFIGGSMVTLKRKRKYLSGSIRRKIWEHFDKVCQACGRETHLFRHESIMAGMWDGSTTAHIDHIKPFSKGGKCVPKNFQLLCCACNCSKGAK